MGAGARDTSVKTMNVDLVGALRRRVEALEKRVKVLEAQVLVTTVADGTRGMERGR